MKTQVYSWRLSGALKGELERAARLRRAPLSAVLEQAARAWLAQNTAKPGDDKKTQRKLHSAAERCFGTIVGLGPYHAERVRETVRRRLRGKYGRQRAH